MKRKLSVEKNKLQVMYNQETEKEFFLEKIYMGKCFSKIILKLLTRLTHFGFLSVKCQLSKYVTKKKFLSLLFTNQTLIGNLATQL